MGERLCCSENGHCQFPKGSPLFFNRPVDWHTVNILYTPQWLQFENILNSINKIFKELELFISKLILISFFLSYSLCFILQRFIDICTV